MRSRPPPLLYGDRVLLRLARPGEGELIRNYLLRNRAHLDPWSPRLTDEQRSLRACEQQVAVAARQFEQDRGCRLRIFDRHDQRALWGSVGLSNIVRGAFHACHLGYALDAEQVGKGIMFESLQLVLDYAFGPLNLHRIMANYMPRNERSARLLERLGFVIEGRAESYLLIDGRWEDHVLTAMTSARWRAPAGTLVRGPDGELPVEDPPRDRTEQDALESTS